MFLSRTRMLYAQPMSYSLIKENDANEGEEGGGEEGEKGEKEEERIMAEYFQQNILQSTIFKF